MTEPFVRIRTTDRGAFKRCRRKWSFSSHLRRNLQPVERPSYFWIGTGGHYALEDWHGYNYYGHPVRAFHAYRDACVAAARTGKVELPADMDEQVEMAEGILEHYLEFSKNRANYKTVWIDGEPQCEIRIKLDLPFTHESVDPKTGEILEIPVTYVATIDRMVEIDGEYWVEDYKFYKQFQDGHLDWDQQMTAYVWAAQALYDVPIAGAIMTQFRKALAEHPRILAGGKLSTAKDQLTTHGMYRQAVIDIYGEVDRAPAAIINCMNELAAQEGEDRDRYIRRDRTRRNEFQLEAEGDKILMEVADMLNPDLPMYPNPTKDCSWDCQFNDVCLMMDRDDDWESMLEETTVSMLEEAEEWRQHLK